MKKPTPPRATKSVKLLLPEGRVIDAELVYYPQYRSLFRAGRYCIDLNAKNLGRYFSKATDYFEALSQIRRKLEAKGVQLLCWGARRNVWPSRMGRDMGTGITAYELLEGGGHGQQRSIFDYAPPEMVSTVDEQKEYAAQWFRNESVNPK